MEGSLQRNGVIQHQFSYLDEKLLTENDEISSLLAWVLFFGLVFKYWGYWRTQQNLKRAMLAWIDTW